MNLLFWGRTVSVIGKVMLATGVLMAHSSLEHEHKIDSVVIKMFHIERALTLLGISLIVVGYAMEIYIYNFDTSLLTCTGKDCGAMLINSQAN
jgi:hypothetical protein